MFAQRYFAPRYFAPRYFAKVGAVSVGAGGGYFPKRYFNKNYFAGRYFPYGTGRIDGGGGGTGGDYFPHRYFVKSYYAGRYFCVPRELTLTTPTQEQTPPQGVYYPWYFKGEHKKRKKQVKFTKVELDTLLYKSSELAQKKGITKEVKETLNSLNIALLGKKETTDVLEALSLIAETRIVVLEIQKLILEEIDDMLLALILDS